MHIAALNRHIAVSRAAIEFGADVNAADTVHRAALHLAAENNEAEVVNALVGSGGNIEAWACRGWPPLTSGDWELTLEATAVMEHGGMSTPRTMTSKPHFSIQPPPKPGRELPRRLTFC